MPAIKRKLTAMPNSVNGEQQQRKRRKQPIAIKQEPFMNINIPSECFAQIWADEDDNAENNNVKGENAPSTSSSATVTPNKLNKKMRSKKRKAKQKRSALAAASEASSSKGTNYEVIEISDGEDLYQAFPPPSDATPENEVADQIVESKMEDDNDIVVLFESPKEKKSVASEVEEANNAQLLEDDNKGKQEGEAAAAAAAKSSSTATTQPSSPTKSVSSLSPAIGVGGKIKWPDVYHVTLRPERKIMPKIANYRDKHRKAFKQFDKAIWDHLTQNVQNDHTFIWKMRVRDFLNNTIQSIYSQCELVAVGSTVNGCGAFNSDMDLCLCLPCYKQGYATQRSYATKHLRKVMKLLLKQSNVVKFIQFIPAKVPILNIHFQPPFQTLEVDMNINNTPGIYNSYLLHYYSRIDDRLPALCLLVKHWAKKRGILDACNGFFNSYSVILMVLHFLQCAVDPPILPNLQALYPDYFAFQKSIKEMKLFSPLPHPLPEVPKNDGTVGELLIAFFLYYHRFDFDREAISVRLGQTFRRSHLPANTQRFKVFIEEPFDQQNTARCVTNDGQWAFILATFRDAAFAMFGNQNRPPALGYLI